MMTIILSSPNKCYDIDPLPILVVKPDNVSLPDSITNIINIQLCLGTFPGVCKFAYVNPLIL